MEQKKIALLFCLFVASNSMILANDLQPYTGVYRNGKAHDVVISLRHHGNDSLLVLTDLQTDAFRALFPQQQDVFIAGKELLQPDPPEFKISFHRSDDGKIQSVKLMDLTNNYSVTAYKLPQNVLPVELKNGMVTLKGDLYLPTGTKSFPVVVLAHGSEDSDRFSFDALPNLLAGYGIAVLAYDKRGTGASTGSWEDSGLEPLADDLLSVVAFLKKQKNIDPKKDRDYWIQ